MINQNNRELGWDEAIPASADEFTLLDPGEYEFRVSGMERLRFPGSAKLPPCNQARVHLEIEGTTIKHNLFLHTKTAGLLANFFKAIGARQSGETIQMDWSGVIGATGRCIIKTRKWAGKDGEERESNEIARFLMPDEAGASATVAPPAPPAVYAPQQPQQAPVQSSGQVVDDLPF